MVVVIRISGFLTMLAGITVPIDTRGCMISGVTRSNYVTPRGPGAMLFQPIISVFLSHPSSRVVSRGNLYHPVKLKCLNKRIKDQNMTHSRRKALKNIVLVSIVITTGSLSSFALANDVHKVVIKKFWVLPESVARKTRRYY